MRDDLTWDDLRANRIVENIRYIYLQVEEKMKKSHEKYNSRCDQHKTKSYLEWNIEYCHS